MSEPATLISIATSPWSEKARWALDHHRIPYVEKEFKPMFSALPLRIRLRRGRGRLTVPVLLAGDEAYTDSTDIAQFAERHGAGAPLFRRGEEEEIARWNDVAERAMQAGRALLLLRLAASGPALEEALAGLVPRPLRRALAPVALFGVRFLQHKYETSEGEDEAARRAELRDALLELRAALADGRAHLLGELSYADIAMAAALQFVQPMDTPHIPMGPATRRVWTDLELASELNDLVEWRDQLYAHHRHAAGEARRRYA